MSCLYLHVLRLLLPRRRIKRGRHRRRLPQSQNLGFPQRTASIATKIDLARRLNRPRSAGEETEKEVLTCAKRKAEGSDGGEGGKPSAAAAAATPANETAEAGSAGGAKAAEIKWVEMPLENIAWILSQKREDYHVITLDDYTLHRSISSGTSTAADFLYTQEEVDAHREMVLRVQATDEAGREEFMEFQQWVRDTFERNGCVMVPEGWEEEMQNVVDEEWEKGRHLLEMTDVNPRSNREEEMIDAPSNRDEDTDLAMPSD